MSPVSRRFSSHAHAAHPALHSSPTRRSSDLALARGDEHHVRASQRALDLVVRLLGGGVPDLRVGTRAETRRQLDRKSTRLNSSHPSISYAVFCLKKKKPWSSVRRLSMPDDSS